MLKWAIIGSGDVVNRLVKDSFNTKFSNVKYVYSKDFKQAKKICKKYNYGMPINNLKEILEDKSINCVYIATPPSSHYEFISLFSKKKIHILSEKPIVLEKKHLRKITKLIKKNKISFHYTLVGINKSEELLFLVNELSLTDSVTFLNSIPQEQVYEKMLDSDLFLLPSVEEGIANVCIEAMLSKLPVLSTDCGGMSELIVDSETGFLVPPRNPKALADKISIFSKLQEIDILQLVNVAYIKATTQHTSKQMMDDMISLYNKVYENN